MTAKTEVTRDDGPYDAALLPDVVVRYLDARDGHRFDDAAACFADDAVVFDDGGRFAGAHEISSWIRETSTAWTLTTTRLRQQVRSAPDRPDVVVGVSVRVRLDGNFPGGTVTLTQDFELDSGLITRLRIAPAPAG